MRFIFKTSYDQDIRLARHGGHVFWYGLLIAFLIAARGMPLYAALRILRARRPVARPNEGFMAQLQAFERATRLREARARELGGCSQDGDGGRGLPTGREWPEGRGQEPQCGALVNRLPIPGRECRHGAQDG